MATPRRTFLYHANAHVLSAQFTRPIQHLVEVQGASSLSSMGGHGRAIVENVGLDHFVSVKRGYSHVSGSEQDKDGKKYFTTLVTSVAEGVNLLDVVTADRIVGRYASSYAFDDPEPEFSFLGSRFENLQIAGLRITVEINYAFDQVSTFKKAINGFKGHPELGKITMDALETDKSYEDQEIHGAILYTIVDVAKLKSTIKELQVSLPAVDCRGYCVVIPKFGRLYLGEILMQRGRRSLTMLRFELGSPSAGGGTLVQLDGNGQQWPPTHG